MENNTDLCEIKNWHDATGGRSYIEGLSFDAGNYWTTGSIAVEGSRKEQKIVVKIQAGNIKVLDETFSLKDGEKKVFDFTVNSNTTVNVSGYVEKAALFYGAGADITVTLNRDNSRLLKSESRSWCDATAGISCIENLNLGADHKWQKFSVLMEGYKGKSTGIMVSVIEDGNLVYPLSSWKVLNGTDSAVYEGDLSGNKVPLITAGYITNHNVIGGGAKITLTGYYKDGE